MSEGHRIGSLDALRGLAALVVLIGHLIALWPGGPVARAATLVDRTPIRLFTSPHEPVLLFFCLSGFVLTLTLESKRTGYGAFVTRRVFRIYPMYLAALLLAWTIANLGARRGDEYTWVVRQSLDPTGGAALFLRQALLIDSFDYSHPNTVIWSLIHEMRMSLVLPMIVWVLGRLKWAGGIAAVIATYLSAYAVSTSGASQLPLMNTLHYLPLFVLGSFMALNRQQLQALLSKLSAPTAYFVAALALASITWAGYLPTVARLHGPTLSDAVPSFGIAWLMLAALQYRGLRKALSLSVPQFCGRISYGVYLVQLPLIALAALTVGFVLPLAWVALVAVVLILAVATVGALVIEQPGIVLGRHASRYVSGRRLLRPL